MVMLGAGMAAQPKPAIQRLAQKVRFPAMPDGTCAGRNFRLRGVRAEDAIVTTRWAALDDGLLRRVWVSKADTISVLICNASGSLVGPVTYELGMKVIR